ncbi:MAG TPA: amino acid adenylation domain-containing protein [Vicinamibacterales bacterium]|nr:amino acid adenylation domain-containing protein [Vicinamibacterales bacterium]
MTGYSAPSLPALLDESARRFPERIALVDPAGSRVSYAELADRSDRVASFLASCGVRPGDRVGLIVPKSADAVTALFGIMKAGAVYVPADYTAPQERNRTIQRDCGVTAAFLEPRTAALLADDPGRPPVIVIGSEPPAIEGTHAFADIIAREPTGERPSMGLDDLSYILYTSGSTGIPKGVMLTHRNALAFVDWCSSVFAPTEHDRFSSHAPFHFDLSVLDIYVAIKHGAELHLISEDVGKNPRELAQFIADRALTIWYSTPSSLSLLAQYGNLASRDYRALRIVLFAGEVFPVKHLRDLTRLWSWPEYYNLYGPTETNVCTFARIPLPIPDDRTVPYPIGWPCSHYQDLVLDPDGDVAAPGEEGLLFMSGPGVYQGYWNRPVENSKAFMDRDGVRWYNTGDVVQLDPTDGYLYRGRRDRMVKRRGYRIELGEIERALYQHPQVGEAAAVAVSDPAGVRILVYLSAKTSSRPSIIELKTFGAANLPTYMVPDAFVFMDTLPRTSTDKVDYQRLAATAAGA